MTGQILTELVVIFLAIQVFGYLCRCLHQQWVIGEILAGIVLGPSLLGALAPQLQAQLFPKATLPTLQTLGDIGLILYMFSLGTSLDTYLMARQSRQALAVSLSSLLLPFGLGAILALAFYPALAGASATRLSFALMVGTSMAITAFPVLARLLTERNMLGDEIGTLALTCASINDVMAWSILALVVATVHSASMISALFALGVVVAFVGAMLGVIRPLFQYVARYATFRQLLHVLSFVLVFASAAATTALGMHPVFGAFLMGLILPRQAALLAHVRRIDHVNAGLFLPLYFVFSGLKTHIGLIQGPAMWLTCALIFAVACVGKVSGTMFAAHLIGKSWRQSLTLGVLMNTRGLVELIVLNIGLDAGVLSSGLFAMLVIMALGTTMMASPLLSWLGYSQPNTPFTVDDVQGVRHKPGVPI